jgi:hypothetical protein
VIRREAERQIVSKGFRDASPFVQAFGLALSECVVAHVVDLVCAAIPKDPTSAKSAVVLRRWHDADDAHLRDLSALLAWLHAKAAFIDAYALFPTSEHDAAYRSLMTISGNLFPTSDRAMRMCREYQACIDGGYRSLGGGLLIEGGTYLVAPDAPHYTTHLWMINDTLGGPVLDMIAGPLDPASVFYLQMMTSNLLTSYTEEFRTSARSLYNAMRENL